MPSFFFLKQLVKCPIVFSTDINTGGFRYGINQVIFRTSSGGSSTGGTGGGPNASAQTGE